MDKFDIFDRATYVNTCYLTVKDTVVELGMFVKVFSQIFDSSIAENYELRHFFEDMLKLADVDGVVDMTPEAIHRRINLPLEKVQKYLVELGKPDAKSRSPENKGRRIVPLDSHRDWGWIITNYGHYRQLRDEEARRAYFRDAKRRERSLKSGKPLPGEVEAVKALESGNVARFEAIAAGEVR